MYEMLVVIITKRSKVIEIVMRSHWKTNHPTKASSSNNCKLCEGGRKHKVLAWNKPKIECPKRNGGMLKRSDVLEAILEVYDHTKQ